jgi:CHASE3 domain sensor protein
MKYTSKRAEAIKIINEISALLADNPDYEDYLKPKLEKLLKFVNQ